MIKELILAIALGALLGFGITGGYLAVKKSQKSEPLPQVTPTLTQSSDNSPLPTSEVTPTPENSTTGDSRITLTTPEDKAIVSESKLTIEGTTTPDSSVVITTAVGNYFANSDASGQFSSTIELESGPNIIQVSSIDKEDNQVTTEITVTYSTAKI